MDAGIPSKVGNNEPVYQTFDDLLRAIGQFGPYQKRVYLLLCLPSLFLSPLLVFQVFILAVPDHRCKLPGLENDTYAVQSMPHSDLINKWIPPHDYCHVYSNGTNHSSTVQCQDWVYDLSYFKCTFAMELNMVCDKAIQIPNVQMIFFFGVLIGSLVFGQISDIIGRRKTLYGCIWLQLGSALGLLAMTEYIGFCVLMFLLGASLLGTYMTAYVIGMELVGPDKRLWTGNIVALFLTSGQLYLALMFYLTPNWQYLTLSIAAPIVIFVPYYCLIPESCRWLLSHGQPKEALRIIQTIAKSNKSQINDDILDKLQPVKKEGRVWQLFTTTQTLRIWTIVIFFNWFVCSMSYYGIVLNTANMEGDFLLNFTLMVLIEYPGKIIDVALMDRIGRKRLYILYMLVGGLANISTIGPIMKHDDRLHYVLIGLAMLGKLCITGAFGTVYVHSAEIFPTVVRNAGMGSSSAVARIGSMLAPYIAKSAVLIKGDVGKAIPLTLFGAAMFISGLLTMCVLPETLGKELPEAVEDIENLQRPPSSSLRAEIEVPKDKGLYVGEINHTFGDK